MAARFPIPPFIAPACILLLTIGCAVRKSPEHVPARPPEQETVAEPVAPEKPAAKPVPYHGDLKPFIVRAQASSDGGSAYVAELAFDGNTTSRWTSAFRDNEWLEGYFDRPVGIEQIVIKWETARASDFSMYLLDAKTNWIQIDRRTGSTGPEDSLTFSRPLPARGIRILCEHRATEWGNSIYEVNMTGSTEGPPPTNNLIGFQPQLNPWQKWERGNADKLLSEAAADPADSKAMTDEQFLNLVEKRSFYYFWYETNPTNGLTKDRGRNFQSSEEINVASVAAVGFALTAYAIGAERGWVSRTDALDRVQTTLTTFLNGPVRNVRGLFPHFLNIFTGADATGTEISTIDTALLLAGMITAKEYFRDPEVSQMSTVIFERVDWSWARNGDPHFVTHGLSAQGNFFDARWGTTTEGLLIYLLALGSPTHGLSADSWNAVDHHTEEYNNYRFAVEYGFQSMFRYQYPALWYDFRGKVDKSGVDYFENATLAALAMREYCIRNADKFMGSYGPDSWGLGAADGPGNRYMIYGFPPGQPYSPIDGTVIPYAIAGSVPFLPVHAIRALRKLYDEHHEMWGKYGFADSVNPNQSFVAQDAIGLDAGTILIGIENYRSGFVWSHFMRNRWIEETTRKIGWRTRPRSTDPDGPIDLARDHAWRIVTGGGLLSSPAFDDSTWKVVAVPDHWENLGGAFQNYDGVAWYRVTFNLDSTRFANWLGCGRPITLRIGAVDDGDASYVNGFKVGETPAAPESYRKFRRYNVPTAYLRVGRNVVAIQVTDLRDAGGIWRTPVEIGPE